MKTLFNNNIESNNNTVNKIQDFGAKIGGARKDLYQAANEWAEQLANITPDALTKAGGVSKLVRLPNLEKLTEAGAITAEQARAALIVWRGIERKPSGTYRADRWAERTRARLEAAAAIITATEPQDEDVRDIITAARNCVELEVLTAANWPAEPFTFGKYSVIRCRYSNVPKLQIQDARYYRGTASEDPADIAQQLREMVARDEESRRNIYDGHYNIQYRYYKNGELLAIFNATGYPEKWDVISTLRPPYAGHFSTGSNAAYFGTIYEAQKFMLAEIAKGLQPYHKPTDPAPEPSGDGAGICHSFDTNQDTATLQEAGEIKADPLSDIISKAVTHTHGKGNAARYMLDTIAYYVQSHCNPAIDDDEE